MLADKSVSISLEQSQVCLKISTRDSPNPSKDCSSRTNETTKDLLNLYDSHLWADVLTESARDTLRVDDTYITTAEWHSLALYAPAGVLVALCGLFCLIGLCPIVEVSNATVRPPCWSHKKRVSQAGTSSDLESGGDHTDHYETTSYGYRGCGREGEAGMAFTLLVVGTAEQIQNQGADHSRPQ